MTTYTNQDAHKDVTAEFNRYKSEGTSVDDRITATNAIIDKYLLANDKVPPQSVLERLGTLLLSEDSTNNLSNKTRTEEYPVLSDNQYRRRTEGRHKGRKTKDGKLQPLTREVPFSLAANHGIDGRDYSYPTRRNIDVIEQMDMEYYGKVGRGE